MDLENSGCFRKLSAGGLRWMQLTEKSVSKCSNYDREDLKNFSEKLHFHSAFI
jgi:hypothetical protein